MAPASDSGRVSGVVFYPYDDQNVLDCSVVEVTSTKQIQAGADSTPVEHGTYDGNMGAIFHFKCRTCGNMPDECPGHHGHVNLNWPITHAMFMAVMVKWLRMICIHCFRICVDVSIPYHKFDPDSHTQKTSYALTFVLNVLKKRVKNGIFCDHCNNFADQIESGITKMSNIVRKVDQQPSYKITTHSPYFPEVITVGKKKGKFDRTKDLIYTPAILAIFERLDISELEKLQVPIASHPRHTIFRVLLVPPINLRYIQNTRRVNERNTTVTAAIEAIITQNASLGGPVSEKDPDFDDGRSTESKLYKVTKLLDLYSRYIGIKDPTDKQDGLYLEMTKKYGLIKWRCLGKTGDHVCYVVIGCDPTLPVDVCMISKKFATIITIGVVVTPYNINHLRKFVNNRDKYPGCSEIYSKERGCLLRNNNYEITYGDTVYRNLINGDLVPIGRQPSLTPTNILAFRVRVWEGKEDINHMALNILSCSWFDGDFDGDCMRIKALSTEASRAEAAIISTPSRFFLSYGDASPTIGQAQDSVVGMALLTMHGTVFSRREAMELFTNVPVAPRLTKDRYTGRELISFLIPTNINYTAKSPMFNDPLVGKFGNFHESDYQVVIKDGQLVSGILCGGIIKPKRGSLYHAICSACGPKVALEIIFQHQQMVLKFLEINGTTISVKDLDLSAESRRMIALIQSNMLRKQAEFNAQIRANAVVAPPGISLVDHIDQQSIANLAHGHKYMAAILKSLDPKSNWFLLQTFSGSKGSLPDIYSIFAPVGQLTIAGRRLEQDLDVNRSSIHYRQFSLDPEAYGYIRDSFNDGTDSSATVFIGKVVRQNVLTKNHGSAAGGTLGKRILQVVNSCVSDAMFRTCRGYGDKIIEFSNNDDGFVPSKTIFTRYDPFYMSESEIKATYGQRASIISNDRAALVTLGQQLTRAHPLMKANGEYPLPLDIKQVCGKAPEKTDTSPENLALLDRFCDELHYTRFHDSLRLAGEYVPAVYADMFSLLKIVLRANLTPYAALDPERFPLLLYQIQRLIVDAFWGTGHNIGIIMGQAYSAPITQCLIDAHHHSGSSSKNQVTSSNEILSGKPSKNLTDNSMNIFLKERYQERKANAEMLADFVTSKKFSTVVDRYEILFETWKEHITYPSDEKPLDDYIKATDMAAKLAGTLMPFKFRYVLNNRNMAAYKINIGEICSRLETDWGSGIILAYYVAEGSTILVMYFADNFKWNVNNAPQYTWAHITAFADYLVASTTINDFRGIESATVKSATSVRFASESADGDSSNHSKSDLRPEQFTYYYVETVGINMEKVLLIDAVDSLRTTSNNVAETFMYEGLTSAKMCVITGLSSLFPDTLTAPFSHISNVMISAGYPSPITEQGVKDEQNTEILLRASIRDPKRSFSEAAINGTFDKCYSPTSQMILGQQPLSGTNHSLIVINVEAAMKKRSDTSLENMI